MNQNVNEATWTKYEINVSTEKERMKGRSQCHVFPVSIITKVLHLSAFAQN